MSTGLSGRTAQFSMSGTTVGDIISIGGPEMSRDMIDISAMSTNTTDGMWRTFIPGMIDAGEISLELNLQETNAALLHAQVTNTATNQTMLITLPEYSSTNNQTFSAYGYLVNVGSSIPFDDKMTMSCTIKLTGAVTYA